MKAHSKLGRTARASSYLKGIAAATILALGACNKTTDPTLVIETALVEQIGRAHV